MLILMAVSEPMFYCINNPERWPTETCDAAKPLHRRYAIFSMVAMYLHWIQMVDLAVFSTKLSAFLLVCKFVSAEIIRFAAALVFLLTLFASAISCSRSDQPEYENF